MYQRITSSMTQRMTLVDLNRAANRVAQSQERLSTGRQVSRPSDDPMATGQSIDARRELSATQQQQRSADDATGWLETSDTVLGRFADAAQRARELVLRGASGTLAQEDRDAIALEIETLVDAVKLDAGATFAGRRLLSGTATDTPPYQAGTDDAYRGDAGAIVRTIGPGASVRINASAGEVLGSGPAAGDGKLLHTLRDAAARLRGGAPSDLAALRTASVGDLDRNQREISAARTQLGVTANRVESARARLEQLEETLTSRLSKTEDADVVKTYIEYTSQQAGYQSALKVGAQITQNSLLDFLR